MQYTGLMLWKFKKSDHRNVSPGTPSSSSSATQSNGGLMQGGAAIEKVTSQGAARIENADVAVGHAAGTYVIPSSYRISAMIVTSRSVVVEGELEGSALVAPTVHVGTAGRLNVPTQASTITISGLVEAPVSARDYVEVRIGGSVKAAVEAGRLTVLPGGRVSGGQLSIGPLRSRE